MKRRLFKFFLIVTLVPRLLLAQESSVQVLENIPSSDIRISLMDAESLDDDTLEFFVNDIFEDLIPLKKEKIVTKVEVSGSEFVDLKFKIGINSLSPVRASLDLFLISNDSLIHSGNIRLHRLGQAHRIRIEFRNERKNIRITGLISNDNNPLQEDPNKDIIDQEERPDFEPKEIPQIPVLNKIEKRIDENNNFMLPSVELIDVISDSNTLTYDDVYYIHFKSKTAEIKKRELAKAEKIITKLAEYLKSDDEIKLLIKGHTSFPLPIQDGVQYIDTVGTKEQQRGLSELSEERAATIKYRLVQKGIDANKIRTQGMGYSEPVSKVLKEQYRNQRITARLYNIKIDTTLEHSQTPNDSLLLTMLTEVRNRPSMESSVLTKLSKGTELLILDTDKESLEHLSRNDRRFDKWFKISFNHQEGWVFGKMTNKSYHKNIVNYDNEYKPNREDDFETVLKEGWKQVKKHYKAHYKDRLDKSNVFFNMEILKGHNPSSSFNGVEVEDSFLFVYYVK